MPMLGITESVIHLGQSFFLLIDVTLNELSLILTSQGPKEIRFNLLIEPKRIFPVCAERVLCYSVTQSLL